MAEVILLFSLLALILCLYNSRVNWLYVHTDTCTDVHHACVDVYVACMYMHLCVVFYIIIMWICLQDVCVMVMYNGITEHSFSVWASPVAQTIHPSSRVPSETNPNSPEKNWQ